MKKFAVTLFLILFITKVCYSDEILNEVNINPTGDKLSYLGQLNNTLPQGCTGFIKRGDENWKVVCDKILNASEISSIELSVNNFIPSISKRDSAERYLKSTPHNENSIPELRDRLAKIEEYLFGDKAQ